MWCIRSSDFWKQLLKKCPHSVLPWWGSRLWSQTQPLLKAPWAPAKLQIPQCSANWDESHIPPECGGATQAPSISDVCRHQHFSQTGGRMMQPSVQPALWMRSRLSVQTPTHGYVCVRTCARVCCRHIIKFYRRCMQRGSLVPEAEVAGGGWKKAARPELIKTHHHCFTPWLLS